MALVNEHFLKLPENYFFSDLEKRVNLFRVTHPKADIIRLGTGDVILPLPHACTEAMRKAVGEMENEATFHGYGPERHTAARQQYRGYRPYISCLHRY